MKEIAGYLIFKFDQKNIICLTTLIDHLKIIYKI